MEVQKTIITPSYAEQLLKGNINNRPIKWRHVQFLTKEIEEGRWQLTSETIKIAKSGRVVDGQHRLQAIVQSNTPVETYLATDCEEEIFKVVDTGKVRSASDVAATAGHEYYSTQTAMARLLIYYERGMKDIRDRISNQEILEYIENNNMLEAARNAMTWYAFNRIMSASDMGAVYFLFCKYDAQKAFDFFEGLVRGAGLNVGSPVYVLRNKFQQARMGRYNYNQIDRVALLIKAFNIYLRGGGECTRLLWNPSEGFPVVELPGMEVEEQKTGIVFYKP